MVFGVDDADHDANLEAALEKNKRAWAYLKRNASSRKEASILQGYVFLEYGIAPDPAKVTEIQELTTPKDVSELRSLLGTTNLCCRFIKNYATLTEPLRELTKKGRQKRGKREHWKYYEFALTSAPENAYFDSTKVTEAYTDASHVGVAAVLTQKEPDGDERKVIIFSSRAISSPEQNYSQPEREALAIVWACEHFHLYLYGGRFTVFTDPQPLIKILTNPASKPTRCVMLHRIAAKRKSLKNS